MAVSYPLKGLELGMETHVENHGIQDLASSIFNQFQGPSVLKPILIIVFPLQKSDLSLQECNTLLDVHFIPREEHLNNFLKT